MVTVHLRSHPTGVVPLGEACEFAVTASEPDIETRWFVQHSPIFYLEPLGDWSRERTQRCFLEATGAYTVRAQWRGPQAEGWASVDFRIGAVAPTEAGVRLIQIARDTRIWVPTSGESNTVSGHEAATFALLHRLVKPGSVAYDVGAHLGLYATALGRLVGAAGWLYCIEANPVCVSFLRANLELNQVSNCTILPVALADRPGSCQFTINYFNLFLGIGAMSPFAGKVGHKIDVSTMSLDDLIEQFALRPPDFIKMDIEGGEVVAVPGMRRTLARFKPTLLIELHGRASARPALAAFEGLDYRFQEVAGERTFDGPEQLLEWFPEACLQVVGYPR